MPCLGCFGLGAYNRPVPTKIRRYGIDWETTPARAYEPSYIEDTEMDMYVDLDPVDPEDQSVSLTSRGETLLNQQLIATQVAAKQAPSVRAAITGAPQPTVIPGLLPNEKSLGPSDLSADEYNYHRRLQGVLNRRYQVAPRGGFADVEEIDSAGNVITGTVAPVVAGATSVPPDATPALPVPTMPVTATPPSSGSALFKGLVIGLGIIAAGYLIFGRRDDGDYPKDRLPRYAGGQRTL